jgi:60 kDa SS-A/Ro ribonucleoprotein
MAKEHLLAHGTRQTPQSEAMREDQVPNSAGGFGWEVDNWSKLRRFLILGTEGGSYYANERKLTKDNVSALRACVQEDGPRTVAEIVEISKSGRAPKNDQALFALAYAISNGDTVTKRAAAESLPEVARIGTHLYNFVAYAETMRGWGRTMRWAVSNWYSRNPDQLAYQAIKYRQRDGWSHRDLLRLAHPKNSENAPIFEWIVGGAGTIQDGDEVVGFTYPNELIGAFELAQRADTPEQTAELVRKYRLPREALLTDHLKSTEVWGALLEAGMPMTALIRNLATMTRNSTLDDSALLKIVLDQLGDGEYIRKSRVHPLAILVALRTYAGGTGYYSRAADYTPKPKVIDALDAAFYTAFQNVEPTGKSHLLALDISSSMCSGGVAGSPLSPREASAAMALVTLAVEDNVECVGFHTSLISLNLSSRMRLDNAVSYINGLGFGGTDCSLPMIYATQQNKSFDAFIVYTDSETWAGHMHPKQALDAYRQRSGINARSVVVGMVANKFTIADPKDAGMLDVVGFDTATPNLISQFVAGNI